MRRRHPNHRLVKIHRTYTVEEIANLFGVHKNTVRHWVKDGLTTTDDKRPMLILGHVLVAFLQARRLKNKQPCKPGELYCVRCRAPKSPAGNMADYSPITEKFGNLVAICPDCNTLMNRHVSLAKIGEFDGKVDISFPEALRRLRESLYPYSKLLNNSGLSIIHPTPFIFITSQYYKISTEAYYVVPAGLHLPSNYQVHSHSEITAPVLKTDPSNCKNNLSHNHGSRFLFYLLIKKKQQQQLSRQLPKKALFKNSSSRSSSLICSLILVQFGRPTPPKGQRAYSILRYHAFYSQIPRFLFSDTTLSILRYHAFCSQQRRFKI